MSNNKRKLNSFFGKKGSILIIVIVFTAVFIILGNVALQYVMNQSRATRIKSDKEKAFHIAEAGINYYRWHLAHVPDDYRDGTGSVGPYIHNYTDENGVTIGQFSLELIQPPPGSTIVTIKSTGCLEACSGPNYFTHKSITLKMGIPSYTTYAAISDSTLTFPETAEVYGLVHSNDKVIFDGVAYNKVTAVNGVETNCGALHKCQCPPPTPVPPADPNECTLPLSMQQTTKQFVKTNFNEVSSNNKNESNITETKDKTSKVYMASQKVPIIDNNIKVLAEEEPPEQVGRGASQVFFGGQESPVAAIDFNRITINLAKAKEESKSSGNIYLGRSETEGYHIKFNNTGIEIYKVTNQLTCKYNDKEYEDIYSIGTDSPQPVYSGLLPSNGLLIYVQDDVWVEGTIDGRATIIAAEDPLASGKANIIINKSIVYKDNDGSDILGLVAQNDILVGFYSDASITIDGALMAQKGQVRRKYYEPHTTGDFDPAGCGGYINRTSITLHGSMASFKQYGFYYTIDNSGYAKTTYIYDNNLLYSPPPFFPNTGQYSIISWEED